MSASSINSFLKKVLNDLENTKSGAYRSLVANRRPHHFQFDVLKVAQEVQTELSISGVPVSSQDKRVIITLARAFKTKL